MIILTIVTQVFTLLKTSIAAKNFGTSVYMDAFNFTNNVGIFIFSFIGAGVTTILIPNLIDKKKKNGINIFISFLYTIAIIIFIIICIFSSQILKFISNGSNNFIAIASDLMFIVLLTQLILSLSGITNAIFQCEEKFNIPKLISLITTILLVVIMLLNSNFSIKYYSYYIFLTTFLNIFCQIYIIYKQGFSFKFNIDLKNRYFLDMIRSFIPIMLSTGLYQISLITDTIISSRLGSGQISILNYSNTIVSMINTLLLANIITYIYPKIVKKIEQNDSQERLFELVTFINSIMFLVVLGFFIVGKDGVEILYQRGEFTANTTYIVYICSFIYILSLPVNSIRDLIYRYFYAKLDTMTPFKNSIVASILNIIISIYLSKFIGIYGIIIGTVLTSFISLTMILIRFKIKFEFKFCFRKVIFENLKIVTSMLITLIILLIIKKSIIINNVIFEVILLSGLTIFVYGIILYIFRSNIYKIKL